MSISGSSSTGTSLIARSAFGIVAGLLTIFTAAPSVLADSVGGSATTSANASCSPVAPAPTGITRPTGADSGTYTYNSCTGLWENEHYTWSPLTKQASPKEPYVYRCDNAQWQWVYDQWVFSPAQQSFQKVPFSVAQLPGRALIATGSPTTCAPAPAVSAPTGSVGNASASPGTGTPGGSLAPASATDATVGNQIGSAATTGNATLAENSSGGNTASGNANVTANVVNNVQSSSSLSNGKVVAFTANINGDVQGDLLIDPNQLQPASDAAPLTKSDVTVNTRTSGTINNDVTLNAASGDAAATKNTKAGNVSTGNASAVADVINILNSIVSAGKSFIGVVNINGSLHGNILVPKNFLDQLVATNAPQTSMTISAADAANLGITNNVTSSAASGTATATGNTQAGNVATGDAVTKVTIFNLTGTQLVGSNCLLVFVNAAGTWVGVIMNAPGATAAAIGDATSKVATGAADARTATTDAIHNNIDVAAASGNVSATDNTAAGNIRSGNADTAVNLLNLNNSQLSLSGWFGVLFINVFGTWYGNFGIYSPPPAPAKATGSGQGPNPALAYRPSAATYRHPMFQFAPLDHHTLQQGAAPAGSDTPLTTIGANLAGKTGRTLGASAANVKKNLAPLPVAVHRLSVNPVQVTGTALIVLGLATLVAERAVTRRNERHISAGN